MKLIMTLGLPASGKSTWAADLIKSEKPGTWVRVNKDLLREMLHAGIFSKGKTEKQILVARDATVETFLSKGINVIVDDTNLNPIHETHLRAIAEKHSAEFSVKDFTAVSVETCIERDKKRPNSVGEGVIKQMNKQYLQPDAPAPKYDTGLNRAIVVDLDGTMALLNGRNPFDASTCENDLPNVPVHMVVHMAHNNNEEIIFCSGREERYREQTENWLLSYGFGISHLYMRPTGDFRKDSVIKKEIYEREIKGKFNVSFVLDDRDQVVEFWRGQGLTCFQVAPGNF